MHIRSVVACLVVGGLAGHPARAQATVNIVAGAAESAGAQFVRVAPGHANAPLLRSAVSLDLRDTSMRDALREIARQMGGHLMYDEGVASLHVRVTLQGKGMAAGDALREVLKGTDVKIFMPTSGNVVILKRASTRATADSATIRGRVLDAGTKEPVGRALVSLDGTNYRTTTTDDGLFTLTAIPTGHHVVVIRRIGYTAARQDVTLEAGEDTTIVVSLKAVPSRLAEVVTTGSGERRRLEMGNSITVINVEEEVKGNAFQNLSDLLASRAPGLTIVRGGGSVNSPSRWRIRGINSINESNDPIVIIDGVRAASGYQECADPNLVGCNQVPSRFDDIDINDIETIEIMKGPSAAALWGSDASNGVIVIKTKRGRSGPTRWSVRYDEGFTFAPTDFPVPTQGLGTAANGTAVFNCRLADQAQGRCVPIDSVAGGFNRYSNPRTTSMATGRMTNVGLSASGGDEAMQFYFAGGYKTQVGTSKMPEVDQKLVQDALGMPLPHWMVRPDQRRDGTFSGRLTGRLAQWADYAVTTDFMQVTSRTGPDGVMDANSDLRSAADTLTLDAGWKEFYAERKNQTNRFVGSIAVNVRPLSWLSGRAVVGRDYAFNTSGAYRRRNWCLPFCTASSRDAKGMVNYGEGREMVQTVDLGSSINFPVGHDFGFRTSLGAQHTRRKTHDLDGSTFDLPDGRIDFNSSPSANRRVFESSDDQATFGMYVSQSVSYKDRLFLNVAARRDVGSSLGTAVAPVYPKWNASWLISEEPFFEGLKNRGVSLRLRAAYGHAGVQPASTAKLRAFSQLPRFVESDGSFGDNYAIISGVGNDELRPERSVEREGGFELGLWHDRFLVDYTAFNKFTKDAIVDRPLSPSLGLSSIARQQYNIGDVLNTGTELLVTARPLDAPNLQWTMTIGYASRQNKLKSLGENVEPFSITASNIDLSKVMDDAGVVMPGYPLFGRWARPVIGYSDANHDGLLTPDEVKLSDSLAFMGPSEPKADVSLHSDLGFWHNRIQLGADLYYVNGLTQVNQSTNWFFNAANYDPSTPLSTQACVVAATTPLNDDYCFYETVNVLRLQNVSIGFLAPTQLARKLGAQSVAVYLMGSNLGVWSGYDGIDPMANTADAAGNQVLGGAIVPRGKTWTVRAQLTF